MKSLIAAAVAAACLSTSAFALTTPATLSDIEKDQLIEQCLAKGTLDPDTLEGRPESEVIEALQQCANGPAATRAAAPAPAAAPVYTAPAPRYSRSAAVVEEDDPAPSFSGRRGSGRFDGGRFGRGGGRFDGGSRFEGGGDQAGTNTGGGNTTTTDNTNNPGPNPGPNPAPKPGPQTNNAPPLTNIQKDALIGDKLKAGESKSSVVSTKIDGGLEKRVGTTVTKDANGNVTVTQATGVFNAAGQQVAPIDTKNQKFTPDDISQFKVAHGDKPLDNIPTLAAKKNAFKGKLAANGQKSLSLGDKLKQNMANAKSGTKNCIKAPCNTAATGQAGKTALDRFKDRLAKHGSAQAGNTHQAGKTALDRFKQMQAKSGNTHQAGKTALDRFKQMQAKAHVGNKVGHVKTTGIQHAATSKHLPLSSNRGSNRKVASSHAPMKSSAVHHQLFKQHAVTKSASSHKSSSGSKKMRVAHR